MYPQYHLKLIGNISLLVLIHMLYIENFRKTLDLQKKNELLKIVNG